MGKSREKSMKTPPSNANTTNSLDQQLTRAILQITDNQKLVNGSLDEVIGSQKFLSSSVDEILVQIKDLSSIVSALRNENNGLKKELQVLTEKYDHLSNSLFEAEEQLDMINRPVISRNVIVSGLPREANENTTKIVEKTLVALNSPVSMNTVESCGRLKQNGAHSGNVPIKITFKNEASKRILLEAKRVHGKLNVAAVMPQSSKANMSVTVRSDLSPLQIKLLHELRRLQTSLQLCYVWPGLNGDILVKIEKSSKPIVVKSRAGIERIKKIRRC